MTGVQTFAPAKEIVISSASEAVDFGGQMPLHQVRLLTGSMLLLFAAILIFLAADGLTMPMRLALMVFATTLVCWTIFDLPETPVALAGALALGATGTVSEEAVFAALGNDIVWLMIAAFVIASVLQASGLVERLTFRLLAPFRRVSSLFWAVTLTIFVTAFIIPSTSARAAIFMPVFLGLTTAIDRPGVTRALALLFPSIVLLSAAASLTGAGAHLVAADFIRRSGGGAPNFLDWALLAAPFGLITSLIACGLILRFFLSVEDRNAVLEAREKAERQPLLAQERTLLAVTALIVLALATSSLHGVALPFVALIGALVMASEKISGMPFRKALKTVEWNLLLFLAGTLVIGEALMSTGTAALLADRAIGMLSLIGKPPVWLVILFTVILATLAHIVVASRTARATVLIPALALPLAGLGVEPAVLIMAATLGSGFCQTLMVSAKPVALFGSMEPPAFTPSDLMRLAAMLLIPFIGLLTLVAAFVWPLMGLGD
ncbi:anion transporter [Ensifer adhaerens]|uniref:Anion transporter n=1 Tax=Ensifer adhaerens TaxID=106592 RepID=A0ACC5ST97_ENSAD|nr:SLC13 family permease [Ensifer adhaerens]MBP1872106.1 anion transporter [Ensifer adhaerens]